MNLKCTIFAFAVIAVVSTTHPALALKVEKEQVILDSLDDYDLCQNKDYDGSWCHDALLRWVNTHPNDAFKAGKLTRRRMNYSAAVPFFAIAFDHKAGDCKDEDVKMAVISALGLPGDATDMIAKAKSIVFKSCPNELTQAVADGLSDTSNVCHELIAAGKLSGVRAKKCK